MPDFRITMTRSPDLDNDRANISAQESYAPGLDYEEVNDG